MREIKFRYWCRYECEMYPKAYMEEHMDLAFMSELLEAAQKRYILMQYTGLTDRNGKEIYEGDIVKGKDDDDKRIIGEVQYRMTSFKVNGIGKYTFIQCQLNREFEIIGNRYEHPDLLEG